MTVPGFEFSEGAIVEMWTTRRLPYDTKSIDEKVACARLSDALKRMPSDQSRILSAAYTSLRRGRFDIENVLAYNVGLAAFKQTGQRGMSFKRVWAAPPFSPSGEQFDHHHAYQLVPSPSRPTDGITLTVQLPTLDDPARVWWAVGGAAATDFASRCCRPIAGRFALHVEVGMIGRRGLPQVIKKLLDGIVAGLQVDPDPHIEAADRLARYLSQPVHDVISRLSKPAVPVLVGRDRLLRPSAKFVHWYPEDDRCDSIAVVATGSPGLCTVTITELKDASSAG